jgi:hypothetical protein
MRSERVYEVHRTSNGSRWESSRQRESAIRTQNDKRVVVGADTPAVKNERYDDAHHTNTLRDYLFPPKQAPRNMKLAWVSRWSDTTPHRPGAYVRPPMLRLSCAAAAASTQKLNMDYSL